MKGTLKKGKESKKRNGEESNDEERLRHFGNKIIRVPHNPQGHNMWSSVCKILTKSFECPLSRFASHTWGEWLIHHSLCCHSETPGQAGETGRQDSQELQHNKVFDSQNKAKKKKYQG